MAPLLFYVPKPADEAGVDYLARIAHYNGYRDVFELWRKLSSNARVSGRSAKPNGLTNFALAVQEVQLMGGHTPAPPELLHMPTNYTPLESSVPRICAECWRAQPYYKAYWRFQDYDQCHLHGCEMIESNEPGYGAYYRRDSHTLGCRDRNQWNRDTVSRLAQLMSEHSMSLSELTQRNRRNHRARQIMTSLSFLVAATGRLSCSDPFGAACTDGRLLEVADQHFLSAIFQLVASETQLPHDYTLSLLMHYTERSGKRVFKSGLWFNESDYTGWQEKSIQEPSLAMAYLQVKRVIEANGSFCLFV